MATITQPLRAPVRCGICEIVAAKQTIEALSRVNGAGLSYFRPTPLECLHLASRSFHEGMQAIGLDQRASSDLKCRKPS